MAYVIGTGLDYIKIHTISVVINNVNKKLITLVEHGLNLSENPTIFNDKAAANEILNIIQNEDIKFENKNILSRAIDEDDFDVSKLKVYQMVLFDTTKDIIEQMKFLIGER